LDITFTKFLAKERGARLHAFAAEAIRLGIELELGNPKRTLSLYVNDAIGYKMTPEQSLCYSENCFGKADTISFRRNFLRIHDYKSGSTPTSMHQVEVYAALFCLEYNFKPENIKMELRLYQSNEVITHRPPPEDIRRIMEKIVIFDQRIDKLKNGEGEPWKTS
jgi:hypothetical protein